MPELPEVETIKNDLNSKVVGREIIDVKFLWPKTLKGTSLNNFIKIAIGKKVKSVKRRAKLIIIELDGDYNLVFHMKMSGHLLVEPDTKKVDKKGNWITKEDELSDSFNQYIRAIIWLSGGIIIAFSDLRKFGYVKLLNDDELSIILKEYGPEPFSKEFNENYLENLFSKKKMAIKEVLMNQKNIAGIGNIYADEILFVSNIHPKRPANKINNKEIKNIMKNTKTILARSIKLRGTSTSDFRDTDGKKGGFESKLKVYRRNDEPCYNCNTNIKRIVVGGRGTHYCPRCQK